MEAGHLRVDVCPVMMPQLLSCNCVGAEGKTLLGSNFGPDAMEVTECPIVSSLEPDQVPRAMGNDEDVIRKRTGDNMKRAHVSGPRRQKE